VARLSELLRAAQRPILWLGGSGWTEEAGAQIAEAAERMRIPVVTAWRRKDLIDNAHPCFAGEMGLGANPALVERVRQADLVISVGARLSEVQTHGYTLPTPPVPAQPWAMIHPDAEVLAGVYRPALSIQAHVRFAARVLLELAHVAHGQAEASWATEARAAYAAWSQPTSVAGGVNMAEVVAHMTRTLPDDAILTNGAGNFSAWVHRFHQHRRLGTQLAPTSGAMGYGFPAGLTAKLLHPDRDVVTVAGDGDFLMSAHELATAARYGVNLVTLVVDNGQYGTIAMHQARDFPGRRFMVDMTNPDFAAMAESYGAFGATVTETAAFPEAFAAARASGKPAVIALRTDPREIAPGVRLPG
jgi:acetolactate synthase-1/2/3 large subunit